MDTVELLKLVYMWGALPLLVVAVKVLWNKTERHEKSIEKLNELRNTDLKNNSEEYKGLLQNTLNTINDVSSKIDK